MTNVCKFSASYKILSPYIWNIKLLWNEYLTVYEPNQNEITSLWILPSESALIHQGVLLKYGMFKIIHIMVIFGFIGHVKFIFLHNVIFWIVLINISWNMETKKLEFGSLFLICKSKTFEILGSVIFRKGR